MRVIDVLTNWESTSENIDRVSIHCGSSSFSRTIKDFKTDINPIISKWNVSRWHSSYSKRNKRYSIHIFIRETPKRTQFFLNDEYLK